MILGILSEPGEENRVALVPRSIKKLSRTGLNVVVEAGSGSRANYSDNEYSDNNVKVVDRSEVLKSDVVVSVRCPEPEILRSGQIIICTADPFRNADLIEKYIDGKITLLSMDMIPRRLSHAQSMDVNSSQDNLAGYKAVLLGAANLPVGIPMMTTSAGTVRPAKVVVMGSGVAGLQAIATAKRLGAVVYASDVRSSAAEQIESVGGRFIKVDGMDDFEDASGYAKPLTNEFIEKVNQTVCGEAEDADLIITTARIFGRPAPLTIPSEAVSRFKSGAVIVDMNADVGGNCEDTVAGEIITTANSVTVIGTENLPGMLAQTASLLYSNNIVAFILSITNEGSLHFDDDNDILFGPTKGTDFFVEGMGGVFVCSDGKLHSNQTRLGEMLS